LEPSRRFILFMVVVLLAVPLWGGEKVPKGKEPYALIFGTVFGPDDRPVYGVKVVVRRADKKKGGYELVSDHRGEFAQRVPPGPADYFVWADLKDSQAAEKTKVKVHLDKEERQDVTLHLTPEKPEKK